VIFVGELTPFFLFWVLMYLGREELGLKGIVISILIGLGLVACYSSLGLPHIFVLVQALLDIVLAFIIFGENMNTPLR
jgi:hypothetical protein